MNWLHGSLFKSENYRPLVKPYQHTTNTEHANVAYMDMLPGVIGTGEPGAGLWFIQCAHLFELRN